MAHGTVSDSFGRGARWSLCVVRAAQCNWHNRGCSKGNNCRITGLLISWRSLLLCWICLFWLSVWLILLFSPLGCLSVWIWWSLWGFCVIDVIVDVAEEIIVGLVVAHFLKFYVTRLNVSLLILLFVSLFVFLFSRLCGLSVKLLAWL